MNRLPTAKKVVILDRDGTVVIDKHYLNHPAELEFLPGAAEGLRCLFEHGFELIVITNQSGVGRGLFSARRLKQIHRRLSEMVLAAGARLAAIYVCPHVPADACECRKPRMGLLLRAASDLNFRPDEAIVIGDKPSDIGLGRSVGATTVLIAAGSNQVEALSAPDHVVRDLAEAARLIGRLPRYA